MLYWEMRLEKNATWQAGCSWYHDRTDFECRSEIYNEALAKLQSAAALLGFSPERDIISIRLRVGEHQDPSYDHAVIATWSTCVFGDIKPLDPATIGCSHTEAA